MMISIFSDLFTIFGLIFTINMAQRHAFQKSSANRQYIALAFVLISLIIAEKTTLLVTDLDNGTFAVLNRIANTLGFVLTPIFSYLLLVFSLQAGFKQQKKLLAIPLLFNSTMCVLSNKTGWVFYVDSNNHYSRGFLFLVPVCLCLLYYIIVIIILIKGKRNYNHGDLSALFIIILMPIIAATFQIINKELVLIWNCVAISLILYYVFLREMQFTLDIQTDVKNRAAFEKEMLQCMKRNINAVIISFDVNNLKQTNDKYGHKSGDKFLFESAQAIKQCFDNLGYTYRVGGDEFCAVCEEVPTVLVEYALANLDKLLVELNQTRHNKLEIAYGFAVFDKDGDESIYTVFSKADKSMYKHKAQLKQLNSCKAEI